MKNIYKSIFIAFIALTIYSCENDKDPVVSGSGLELRNDANVVAPSVLDPADSDVVFANYDWDVANNGPASVSKYSLFIFDHDNDPNLENGVKYTGTGIIVSPDARNATLTVSEFNNLINLLPTFKCSQMNIDVRIKSVLGVNPVDNFTQFSNPITYAVTPYSTAKPILAFVKQGEDPKAAPRILASSFTANNDYEGYMYLQPGTYKFYQPDACGDFNAPTIYGGASNMIDSSSSSPSITIVNQGHYLVKANLTSNTYSIREYRAFGVFGKATRTGLGFTNSVPMSDLGDNKWELTMDLIKGEKFKFKSNMWTGDLTPATAPNLPYVPGSANSFISILGKLSEGIVVENAATGQGDITVPGTFNNSERQTFKIELDVSNPRNYTYKLTQID
jgi:starch-binding outer membrane protein SusE/F